MLHGFPHGSQSDSHSPRFRKPPYDPGRSDFPNPVLTLACLRSPSRTARGLSADPHTPLHFLVCFQGRSIVHRPYIVRLLLELPSAQSPFARARCYLARRGLLDLVSRHYPAFFAHTDSCASPKPSHRLRSSPWSAGLCRLSSVPAGNRTFPTLSLRIFPHVLGPLPRLLLWCTCCPLYTSDAADEEGSGASCCCLSVKQNKEQGL